MKYATLVCDGVLFTRIWIGWRSQCVDWSYRLVLVSLQLYDELDETKNSMIGRCDKQYFLHISVSYLALVHSYFGNEELLAWRSFMTPFLGRTFTVHQIGLNPHKPYIIFIWWAIYKQLGHISQLCTHYGWKPPLKCDISSKKHHSIKALQC